MSKLSIRVLVVLHLVLAYHSQPIGSTPGLYARTRNDEDEPTARGLSGSSDVGVIFDFRKMRLFDMYRLDIYLHEIIEKKAKVKANVSQAPERPDDDVNASQLDLIYRRPKPGR
jgi:hypothetical protein